jgi:hypothetical protein
MEALAAECDIIGNPARNPALPPDSGDSYSMRADQFNGAPKKWFNGRECFEQSVKADTLMEHLK